jgi:hypothetical protein
MKWCCQSEQEVLSRNAAMSDIILARVSMGTKYLKDMALNFGCYYVLRFAGAKSNVSLKYHASPSKHRYSR